MGLLLDVSSDADNESENCSKVFDKMAKRVKNRRFQAMQELIAGSSYFSESEMMKRAPLLYNELVGQYLTADERRLRDKISEQETLVEILMEGIERDDARELRKKQEEIEDNAMEEEDSSSDDEETNESTKTDNENEGEPRPGHSQWGEFEGLADKPINKDEFFANAKTVKIDPMQKKLLLEEFQSLMYQSFLDGKDDYDYATVDNDEQYDNLEILTQDEQDKYFDSEEPDEMTVEENVDSNLSDNDSEDELEIYMNSLQTSHPAVVQLSDDMQKL